MRPACCAISVEGTQQACYQHPQEWLFHFSPFPIASFSLDTLKYNLRMLQNYDLSFDFLWQSTSVEAIRFRAFSLGGGKTKFGMEGRSSSSQIS